MSATRRDELRERILAEVRRIPSPTRAQHDARVAVVVAIGALATASLFFATSGFAPGTRPIEMVAFTAGFGLVAAAVLTRLAAGRGRSMLGRPRHVLVTACIVTAPALALVALAAALVWPGPASEPVTGRAHLACSALTVAQGAAPLVALLVPRRGTDPIHPAVTGAALGMTAGAWSAMMAYLRCPHAAALHCVAAHVAPTLVLMAIGAALGWVLLRVR
jgi:hypothetical protein